MILFKNTESSNDGDGGVHRVSLFWKLLSTLGLLALLPLAATGIVVSLQVESVRRQAENTSRVYEKRAERIAEKVTALLLLCEQDLRELAQLERTDKSYEEFANSHMREVWIRAGTNAEPSEEHIKVPLYKEVSFIDISGKEQVLVIRGRPIPSSQRRNVADPSQTTYRSEDYFLQTLQLGSGEIYVSHLAGFHVNKIEALGVEKIINGLERKTPQEKIIYRYLLYEILRTAEEVVYVGSYVEESRTVLIYKVPEDQSRILVEAPPNVNLDELQARELELKDLIGKLAPEHVVESANYDGVIRFAMPVEDAEKHRVGVVSIALDHIHLTQLTQHIKAMEENAVVFAGYLDADYTYLFDDEGWIITHPKTWDIRGFDRLGRLVPPYTENTSKAKALVGSSPVNLMQLDWKMGEGYHTVVQETQKHRTGIATSKNLSGILRTRVYSPIFYSTGPYSKNGIFGGVMMGTRVDQFINLLRQLNTKISEKTADLHRMIIGLFVGVLMILALLSVLMARGLTRPLKTLSEAARSIGNGNLETPIPCRNLRDEIGELANSFGGMTRSLKKTIEQLEERNLELKSAQQKLMETEKVKRQQLQREVEELQKEMARTSFAHMIAESPLMKKLQEEVVRISKSSATVLILGENGSGKELVAEAIHRNSPRRDKHFLRINCSAFNENLLESELFGHLKGSYTGATSNRKGLFVSADGGTLLLDEIGDMSLDMQKKLLRTLQEGEVVPVGSNQVVQVDVRILAATNKDLQQLMKDGRFREDLFHRINVISIRVPPLRERKEDIIHLAKYFLKTFCGKENKKELLISEDAERFLLEYPWPGNVRELENAIERAVIRSRGSTLMVEDFQPGMEAKDFPSLGEWVNKGMTLQSMEKAYIQSLLEKNAGNKRLTAEKLGIAYNTLLRKLKDYEEGS